MIFRELFASAGSFETFLKEDEDVNREKTLEIYENIFLEEQLIEKIKKIDKPIYVLAFAEIWCPDCMINVPALQKMRDINENIKIGILPREGNEAYMEDYKVGGKTKLPTFVILEENYKEKGVFIETPKIVRDIVANGNEVEVIVAKRKYKKGEYITNTIEEILAIIFRK
ncbi:thioredoxin family protein [Clostridium formicaceticum]|uniref:Thioredoxin family protein n=1 Tax=Clostridium formicaceticum TaxID=1497 RepID=A0AAC9RPU0_9CLOT|nr:thioredoxin family protein [Clostridium formicaceticum]AOY75149.1 thioredoxin family protein [Clostridium formicaceticum]ARE89574.1 hypothetical protein CLFO_40520 [Clostridium formicaceticum]